MLAKPGIEEKGGQVLKVAHVGSGGNVGNGGNVKNGGQGGPVVKGGHVGKEVDPVQFGREEKISYPQQLKDLARKKSN